ncbi:MAG: hypothetical protein HAW67_04540 [Endozoicomonadaceae bacterium]|nr:hypothetical protein [Endozoicomonadaceae bacterium]
MKNILYRGDCKLALDYLIDKGVRVDLIYLDPPFNSNRTYSMIFNHSGITAQQKAYHDMWDFAERTKQLVLDFKTELDEWEDLDDAFKSFMEAWINILESGASQDRKLLNYLMYMTQRLVRLKKILKDTGSIYFHCDPTASHYIKVIMDGVFGRGNFRNEIIWGYRTGGVSKKWFARKHDVILVYSKDEKQCVFNRQFYLSKQKYKYGFGKKHDYELIEKNGDYYKKAVCRDIWDDIDAIGTLGRKSDPRLGYPTQKPLALLERIIEASSNKGDIVLDPFCGCGTTIEAAQKLKRKWMGIDISGNAIDEIQNRIKTRGIDHKNYSKEYKSIEGNPDTMSEYNRLNPYEKQDWLIRKLNGLPNPKKSGDGGVDGDMTIYLGLDSKGKDKWGKLIFSVKTGKQKKPADLRELKGAMQAENADIGILILDVDPSPKMETSAEKAGKIKYCLDKTVPPAIIDKVQIITASEIIDKVKISRPHSMQEVKEYRKIQKEMQM